MNPATRDAVRHATEASDNERISFPEVVGLLATVGIERYHADLLRGEKTYYSPDGAFETVPCAVVEALPAMMFDAAGVEAAVRAIQGGHIQYNEFCARIAAAGCVGYFVSLAGRRAVYYGRTIDSHTEWFPGSP